jgi:hypothetical protein
MAMSRILSLSHAKENAAALSALVVGATVCMSAPTVLWAVALGANAIPATEQLRAASTVRRVGRSKLVLSFGRLHDIFFRYLDDVVDPYIKRDSVTSQCLYKYATHNVLP